MHRTIAELGDYVQQTLGIAMTLESWACRHDLPFYLASRYELLRGELVGQPCLFMIDQAERQETPAVIQKHHAQLQQRSLHDVIFVRSNVTASERKRLIQRRVPFIVPGNQMYLPTIGIDLREHFRRQKQSVDHLRPSSQVVLLHLLLNASEAVTTPSALAAALGYSAMTMTRACDELETQRLVVADSVARARLVQLAGSPAAIWQQAQPLLRSPIQQIHHLARDGYQPIGAPAAGLTALARQSMLAEPAGEQYAVTSDEWRRLVRALHFEEQVSPEADAVSLEVWRYDPALFARDGCVDPLSLYLSLRGIGDERVEAALDKMIECIPW